MSKTTYLRFTEDREVKDHEGKVVEAYEAGKTYPFENASSVQHWLNRQVAEEVDAPAKGPAKPAPKAEAAAAESKPKP
jgi:hypothetical protein